MVKKILLEGIVLSALFIGAMGSFVSGEEGADDILIKTFEPFVVLELFTSQGCSSCPPADILLEKAKNMNLKNVFALSYHVDYWNYIGWEDPFSNPNYTLKQRKYNDKFSNKSNYTPQIVVNGREHFVGSNAEKLNSAIDRYLSEQPDNFIRMNVNDQAGDKVSFQFEVAGEIAEKRLRGILVLDNRVTEVKRGENRNRTLSNSNIALVEKSFPLNSAVGSGYFEIPEKVGPNEKLYLILLLENKGYDILGAAKFEIRN